MQNAKLKKGASPVDAWEDAKKSHILQLAQMTQQQSLMKNIVHSLLAAKSYLRRFIHQQLMNLYVIQGKIKELANMIVVYNEALTRYSPSSTLAHPLPRQKSTMQQLSYVERLPQAYQAAVEEVSRRRKFGKKLTSLISETNSSVASLLSEEKTKRKE